MRGRVARAHRNRVAINIVFDIVVIGVERGVGRNRIVVRRLINKMLEYSAINRRAKRPPLYSVLKPDTSSDSPSARSNGVRFVSARFVIIHIIKIIGAIIKNGVD